MAVREKGRFLHIVGNLIKRYAVVSVSDVIDSGSRYHKEVIQGEVLKTFQFKEDAIRYIESLNMRQHYSCAIIEIYTRHTPYN